MKLIKMDFGLLNIKPFFVSDLSQVNHKVHWSVVYDPESATGVPDEEGEFWLNQVQGERYAPPDWTTLVDRDQEIHKYKLGENKWSS